MQKHEVTSPRHNKCDVLLGFVCSSLVSEACRSERWPCRPPCAADAQAKACDRWAENEREVKQAKPHHAAMWQDDGAYATITDST